MLVDLESTLQMNYINNFAPVAQLDRVSVSEAEGRRFDSCQAHHIAVTLIFSPSKTELKLFREQKIIVGKAAIIFAIAI